MKLEVQRLLPRSDRLMLDLLAHSNQVLAQLTSSTYMSSRSQVEKIISVMCASWNESSRITRQTNQTDTWVFIGAFYRTDDEDLVSTKTPSCM